MTARIARTIDASTITLSGLCVLHCLAIPVMAAFLPFFSVFSEQEWIHKLMVVLAMPLTGYAIFSDLNRVGLRVYMVPAIIGIALLVVSAFVEALHDLEVQLTVLGSLLLAGAHLTRWFRSHR